MHTRVLILAFSAVLALAGLAGALADGLGSGKFALLGPDGVAWCDGGGVVSGTDTGNGFAVINTSSDGTVSATVSLKGLTPDTDYVIRLIQGVDCYVVDATVTTNRQGNATVHLSEASVSGTAFIAVDEGSLFGAPMFVTETYNQNP